MKSNKPTREEILKACELMIDGAEITINKTEYTERYGHYSKSETDKYLIYDIDSVGLITLCEDGELHVNACYANEIQY